MNQGLVAQLIEAGPLIEERQTPEDRPRDLAGLTAPLRAVGRCSVVIQRTAGRHAEPKASPLALRGARPPRQVVLASGH